MEGEWLTVGITTPSEWSEVQEEAKAISRLLQPDLTDSIRPLDFMHIRKPESADSYSRTLIEAIPYGLHDRLILHSNYSLIPEVNLQRIHFKKELGMLPMWNHLNYRNLKFSRSCHSIAEFSETTALDFEYTFLSPIFDSISKHGYFSRFDLEDPELRLLLEKETVVALGGVTPAHFPVLFRSKFAGAALLGYLWGQNSPLEFKVAELIEAKRNLKN